MSSRTALRRERIAQSVLDGALGNLPVVTETLGRRLQEDGVVRAMEAGMQPPVPIEALSAEAAEAVAAMQSIQQDMAPVPSLNWADLQRFFAWLVTYYTSNYMILDDVHQQESSEEWVPRDVRDQAVSSAYQDMVAVRRYVSGVLDPRAADSLLGLQGSTATQPVELRRQMQSAIRRLRNPESHVPPSRIEGLEPDWEPAIRQLERGLVQLDEAVQGLAAESAAARHAQARRDAALAAHRDVVTACGFMLRGMYVLAGKRDLLPTLRSPFSRTNSELVDEDDGLFSDDEPSDEEADETEGDVNQGSEEGELVESSSISESGGAS